MNGFRTNIVRRTHLLRVLGVKVRTGMLKDEELEFLS